MPSTARRRKRKSTFPITGVLWVLFGVHLAIALNWSPLTQVRSVRVVGLPVADEVRVSKALRRLQGIPSLQVRPDVVQTEILKGEWIEQAEYTQNLFGRGLLKVSAREPIATIEGFPEWALSSRGVVYRVGAPVDLPWQLRKSSPMRTPSLAPVGDWESVTVAELARDLAKTLPEMSGVLEVSPRGVISLQFPQGCRVVMGSSEKLPEKLDKLAVMVGSDPDLFERYTEVNLTVPNRPMVVR